MPKYPLTVTLAMIAAMTQMLVSSNGQTGSATVQVSPTKRSITGTVQNAETGEPIAEVHVFVAAANGRVSAETDSLGRYRLEGLAPGGYWVYAYGREGIPLGFKKVTLNWDRDLTSVDFRVQSHGEIAGLVQDEHGKPLSGLAVYLIAPEYAAGELRYSLQAISKPPVR